MKTFLHRFNVGDRPDHAARCMQVVKGFDGIVECPRVERTKSLVDEESLDSLTAPRSALAHHIGESKGESKGCLELLTTRQRVGPPWTAGVSIEHFEVKAASTSSTADILDAS